MHAMHTNLHQMTMLRSLMIFVLIGDKLAGCFLWVHVVLLWNLDRRINLFTTSADGHASTLTGMSSAISPQREPAPLTCTWALCSVM